MLRDGRWPTATVGSGNILIDVGGGKVFEQAFVVQWRRPRSMGISIANGTAVARPGERLSTQSEFGRFLQERNGKLAHGHGKKSSTATSAPAPTAASSFYSFYRRNQN
jgi:hypothetical protein